MKHTHGIEITLHHASSSQVTEYANAYANGLAKYNGRVGSRLISERVGKPFRVCIKLRRTFKIYKAKGVKIVIVTFLQDATSGRLKRRSQAWWLEVTGHMPEAEYVLDAFTNGDDITAKNQRVVFAMPQPADDFATATSDWVVQECYSANRGCIAVFVERGVVDMEMVRAEFSPRDTRQVLRHKPGSPLPIRLHWFCPLRSDNSNPYVFEFRNMRLDAVNTRHLDAPSDVGYDTDDVLVSGDESVATSASFHSEDEAIATDVSDADSSSESDAPVIQRKGGKHALPSAKGCKRRRVEAVPSKRAAKPRKWGPLSAERPMDWKQRASRDQDDEEPLPRIKPKTEVKPEDKTSRAKAKRRERKGHAGAVVGAVHDLTRADEASSTGQKTGQATAQQSKRCAITTASEHVHEDEQALNDELRAIEIRQKLRRMKKLGKPGEQARKTSA